MARKQRRKSQSIPAQKTQSVRNLNEEAYRTLYSLALELGKVDRDGNPQLGRMYADVLSQIGRRSDLLDELQVSNKGASEQRIESAVSALVWMTWAQLRESPIIERRFAREILGRIEEPYHAMSRIAEYQMAFARACEADECLCVGINRSDITLLHRAAARIAYAIKCLERFVEESSDVCVKEIGVYNTACCYSQLATCVLSMCLIEKGELESDSAERDSIDSKIYGRCRQSPPWRKSIGARNTKKVVALKNRAMEQLEILIANREPAKTNSGERQLPLLEAGAFWVRSLEHDRDFNLIRADAVFAKELDSWRVAIIEVDGKRLAPIGTEDDLWQDENDRFASAAKELLRELVF